MTTPHIARNASRAALCLALALVALALAAFSRAQPPLPPKPARFVTDRAGALDPSRASALNEKLADDSW